MRGPQNKLAAYPLEGPQFGDIVQHHDSAENLPVRMTYRGQAVGQETGLFIYFQAQVFRYSIQAGAS
ncbi:hypothetical protein D3C84_966430 [compost metagenome]